MGCCVWFFSFIFFIILSAIIAGFLLILFSPINAVEYEISPVKPFPDATIAINDRLSEMEQIGVGEFEGPESLVNFDGEHELVFPKKGSSFKPVSFDDFDFLPNGKIILSEGSTTYQAHSFLDAIFDATPDGRLLEIDLDTGKWKVFADKLFLPNGVQLHADGKSVLVVETNKYRILRFSLDGGSSSVFADGLHGMPDNIRKSPRGGYWVPVTSIRGKWMSDFFVILAPYPKIRKLMHQLFPLLPKFTPKSAMLLRFNDDGDVVEVWRDTSGKVRQAAEVCETKTHLYIGSFIEKFIGSLTLKKDMSVSDSDEVEDVEDVDTGKNGKDVGIGKTKKTGETGEDGENEKTVDDLAPPVVEKDA